MDGDGLGVMARGGGGGGSLAGPDWIPAGAEDSRSRRLELSLGAYASRGLSLIHLTNTYGAPTMCQVLWETLGTHQG